MKNNFCSFAPPPTRVIERYADCSNPTPLKIEFKDRNNNLTYVCRSDTAANALLSFQQVCKQDKQSTYTPPTTCPNLQESTGTDHKGNKVKYFGCSGRC